MEPSSKGAVTGHCLCGDVRFAYSGAPIKILHCHCESCRRHVSGPIATFVCVDRATMRFSGAAPQVYVSSPGVRRMFCGRCGSPIAYQSDRNPQQIDLFLGALDDPAAIKPTYHVFLEERLPWFDTADALPRYARSKSGHAPVGYGPLSRAPAAQ